MRKKPLTDKDGEVRELTAADMKKFKPLKEVDPELYDMFKKRRGRPKLKAPREMLSLRLKSEIVREIKSSGKGYNTRVEKLLEKALETGLL